MNPLEELYSELKVEGLNKEQSKLVLKVIIEWMYEEYPVMAAVSDIWLKTNGFEN
jgi:hypothetical protein